MPLVHLLAVFCLLYVRVSLTDQRLLTQRCTQVGTEVTIGGWVVTYIIDERGGGPDAGYISAGFFGGLMLGRLVLLPINALVSGVLVDRVPSWLTPLCRSGSDGSSSSMLCLPLPLISLSGAYRHSWAMQWP